MYAGLAENIEDATQSLSDDGLSYEIAGMFLYIGGGEGRDADFARDFESNLENLVASVKVDFAGDPSMPVVVGRQHSHLPLADFPFINTIRAAQDNVGASDPWIATVNTDDVSRRPFNETYLGDSYHFDTVGQLELGRRYANAYIDLVSIPHIDLLIAEIAAGTHGEPFDLAGDGVVDTTDLSEWPSRAADRDGFSAPYLAGDSNLDGTVNANDLNAVGVHWLQGSPSWSAGDFTADGVVNVHDLNAIGRNWEQSIPIASAVGATVPEPSASLLVITGLAFVWRQSRRPTIVR